MEDTTKTQSVKYNTRKQRYKSSVPVRQKSSQETDKAMSGTSNGGSFDLSYFMQNTNSGKRGGTTANNKQQNRTRDRGKKKPLGATTTTTIEATIKIKRPDLLPQTLPETSPTYIHLLDEFLNEFASRKIDPGSDIETVADTFQNCLSNPDWQQNCTADLKHKLVAIRDLINNKIGVTADLTATTEWPNRQHTPVPQQVFPVNSMIGAPGAATATPGWPHGQHTPEPLQVFPVKSTELKIGSATQTTQDNRVNCEFCSEAATDLMKLAKHLDTCAKLRYRDFDAGKKIEYSYFQILPNKVIKCNLCDETVNNVNEKIIHANTPQHIQKHEEKKLNNRKPSPTTEFLYCSCCKCIVPDNPTQFHSHILCKEHIANMSERRPNVELIQNGLQFTVQNKNRVFCLLCATPIPLNTIKFSNHVGEETHKSNLRKRGLETRIWDNVVRCEMCLDVMATSVIFDHVAACKSKQPAMSSLCVFCNTRFSTLFELAQHNEMDCDALNGLRKYLIQDLKKDVDSMVSLPKPLVPHTVDSVPASRRESSAVQATPSVATAIPFPSKVTPPEPEPVAASGSFLNSDCRIIKVQGIKNPEQRLEDVMDVFRGFGEVKEVLLTADCLLVEFGNSASVKYVMQMKDLIAVDSEKLIVSLPEFETVTLDQENVTRPVPETKPVTLVHEKMTRPVPETKPVTLVHEKVTRPEPETKPVTLGQENVTRPEPETKPVTLGQEKAATNQATRFFASEANVEMVSKFLKTRADKITEASKKIIDDLKRSLGVDDALLSGCCSAGLALADCTVDVQCHFGGNMVSAPRAYHLHLLETLSAKLQENRAFSALETCSTGEPYIACEHHDDTDSLRKCRIWLIEGYQEKITKFIRDVTLSNDRVRPYLLLVKFWAHTNDLLSEHRWTNSLMLMAVYFLQTGKMIPKMHLSTNRLVFILTCKANVTGMDAREEDVRTTGNTYIKLFFEFLEFYVKFDFERYAISVSVPGKVTRQSVTELLLKEQIETSGYARQNPLCVMNPFQCEINLAECVTSDILDRFVRCARLTLSQYK